MSQPFTRDDFRTAVFERDNHRCIICGEPAQDAHHIIERRLFDDGGYYLDNGASLCDIHHIEAEATTLSCEEIREHIDIKKIILPEHLYRDQQYDKWGNPILENGQRLRGELFEDKSVKKILRHGNVLSQFTKYIKHPRTYHLPFSPGQTDDDRTLESVEHFKNREIVVTVKMDGENTTLYNDHIHARSVTSEGAAWRTWAKNIWSKIAWNIPEGWRVCAENLQAKHSIKYSNLPSFLMAFSIWNDKNFCLSWDDFLEWCSLFELETVPVLYRGLWNEAHIRDLYHPTFQGNECEGFVVRLVDKFHYRDFRSSCAKFVRPSHVDTSRHWRYRRLEFNETTSTK